MWSWGCGLQCPTREAGHHQQGHGLPCCLRCMELAAGDTRVEHSALTTEEASWVASGPLRRRLRRSTGCCANTAFGCLSALPLGLLLLLDSHCLLCEHQTQGKPALIPRHDDACLFGHRPQRAGMVIIHARRVCMQQTWLDSRQCMWRSTHTPTGPDADPTSSAHPRTLHRNMCHTLARLLLLRPLSLP